MIRHGKFGLKQVFDERFDKNDFETKSKSFDSLLKDCEHFANLEDSEDLYVDCINAEFRKNHAIFEKLVSVMTPKDISLFINLNYDLLKLLALVEPKRHATFNLYAYPGTKVTKQANQLEFLILQTIAEQFRTIAEMKRKDEFAQIQDIADLFRLPEKRRTWKFWRK